MPDGAPHSSSRVRDGAGTPARRARSRTVGGSGFGSSRQAAGYVVRPIPRDREVVLDLLVRASRRFPVHGLVELDVGQAKARIADADPPVTWTGFVVATLARAVARHPEVNARRAGHRLVFFDRVDVGATVERPTHGPASPVTPGSDVVLDAVTVRDADRKSCAAITAELRRAKQAPALPPSRTGLARTMALLPGPVRRTALRAAATRPAVAASFGPSLGVTSLGMFAGGGWAIPIPPLTLIATVCGVVDRAVVRDGAVVVRPMLPLTLSFDHGVVDGAPAARFVATLRELSESAAAFDDPA